MLFNLHNGPSGVYVCVFVWNGRKGEGGGGTTFKETMKLYPHHHNPPQPDSLLKLDKEKDFSGKLLCYETCTQSTEGSQGLFTSLACNSWSSWLLSSPRGEGRTLLWHTSNAHSWRLRLASLITSSVWDITGGSHIYYPICPAGGVGDITTAANTKMIRSNTLEWIQSGPLLAIPACRSWKMRKLLHNYGHLWLTDDLELPGRGAHSLQESVTILCLRGFIKFDGYFQTQIEK